MRVLVLMLLLCGCGGDAAKVVRETVDAVRPKETVVIQVRLDASELPSEQDLALRRALEEQLEVERIGRVLRTGAGVGYFSIEVEVDKSIDAVPRIEALLRERGLRERTTVRIGAPQ